MTVAAAVQPQVSLFCCTALDQSIWVLRSGGKPQQVDSLRQALAALPDRGQRQVLVPAFSRCTSLLLNLYDFKQAGVLDSLQVCSPIALPQSRQTCVDDVLWTAAKWQVSASGPGRWHEFDELDRQSYQLVLLADGARGAALRQHPLFLYLRFIHGLDLEAAARVVGHIRDPRWFVDNHKPRSVARLSSFLGLRPRVQRSVAGISSRAHGHERCADVLAAWKSCAARPANWKVDPGCFLWRTWEAYPDGWQADLRASIKFIKFLHSAWLHLVCPSMEFIPEDFFDFGESAAFREYLSQPKGSTHGFDVPQPF